MFSGIFLLLILLYWTPEGDCKIELTLEGRESGFFLRNLQAEALNNPEDEEEVRRFTLLQSNLPTTLRAQYGPFVSKQVVHPASLHPKNNDSGDARIESMLEYSGDITARLVTREVRRDRPVLRVLFHSATASDPKRRSGGSDSANENRKLSSNDGICVVLYVHNREQHLMAACSPADSRDGVCLAQATLPVSWWPPLESPAWKSPKTQRTWVRVEYAVLRSGSFECSDAAALPVSVPAGLPSVYLDDVPLSSSHGSYEEVKSDDVVRILVPQGPVYPKSKVYVPVYLQPNPIYPPYVFVIRAKVKNGLRILGAQVSPPSQWSITVELNPRQTIATVTAFVKDTTTKAPQEESADLGVQEVFTWLFEVEEGAGYNDNGRITWQLRYMLDSSMAEQYDFDDDNAKITSRLDIHKDDVQAVLPIAKSNQLLNSAVLNGRQVSQPMKVFVVSQAGKVGDVTLQSSCHASDESILKVSPSCTSVYLDGSEIRGSQNASILVKYGSYTGQAHFLVWMPELPLTIRISDTKLSQIKGWRTPHLQRGKPMSSFGSSRTVNHKSNFATSSATRSDRWLDREDFDIICRLRYQQGHIDVYTRFFSVDHNSGRESYLLSRKTELRITDLVSPFLRVADMRIATLQGTVVRGMQSGRTEVQVLSPITGRVSGAKEVRVGTDKETITHLEVTVVAGLQLTVTPDETLPGVFISQTSIHHKLTSQYQEGLLNIKVHFSDGTSALLEDVTDTDYHLSVDTFDSGVVAFAPMAGLHHPRVIAIGKGKGDLLHVTLELAERCQKRRSQPLAMAYAYIDVDFSPNSKAIMNDVRVKSPKNADGGRKRPDHVDPFSPSHEEDNEKYLNSNDASSILYQDAVSHRGKSYHEPAVQARQNLVHPSDLTPLEIGMYALLGVFCLAIFVFLVSCSVFAVRYRRKQVPPVTETSDTVAHAHDWVWLGRATLERNSVNTRCSQTLIPMADFNGNHQSDGVDSSTLKVQRREKNNGTRAIGSGCRSSNVSFPGSEISIRITTNPQELREEEIAMLEKSTSTCPQNNIKPVPIVSSGSATVSREKRVRIVTNPVPPPIPPGNALKLFPPHPPPPVPPHRNLPPLSAHQRYLRDFQLGKFRVPGSDAEWETVAQGMNYDQLIEYFENLKESNA
ncbi:transmembrane protein 132E [Parasteatoda tepidariorum]|uniref:transmembrane protein 132E n=1 Tax=Parasteatoda tepidariorum TaxID=114398 RepID=UPI001C71DA35|nr:transmembrane protein 132E-like [Parasteatoda tepidariorum]